MACIFDLKKKFSCIRKLIKDCTLTMGYSLGMVKIEAFDPSNFMHQFVTLITLWACIFENFLCNRKLIKDCGLAIALVW